MADADQQAPRGGANEEGQQQQPSGETKEADRQEPREERPEGAEQHPSGEAAESGQQSPGGETAEERQQQPIGETADADWQDPFSPEAGTSRRMAGLTDADRSYPYGATLDEAEQPVAEEPPKPAANRTLIYAAAAAGAGILVGVVLAVNAWRMGGSTGPYDLGAAASSISGLTGHLVTRWHKRLEYRLTIEPGDQQKLAGFSLAAGNSPRPLFFDIQLKDASGFVLCGTNIVLKYDPTKMPVAAAPGGAFLPGGMSKGSSGQTAQGVNPAQAGARELERERGRDIFQNEIGQDGQITSISAQGALPCSKKQYESAASWSFSTDFPTLAEQADMLKSLAEAQIEAQASAAGLPQQKASSARRRKAKPKPAAAPLQFFVEGFDVISWADASGGVIGTEGGKTFIIDKTGSQGDSGWQVYPANIHYKCDQNSACILTRSDSTVVLRARLRR